jgi:hypothetical protein
MEKRDHFAIFFQIDGVDYTLQLSKACCNDSDAATPPAATGAITPRTSGSVTPRSGTTAASDSAATAAAIERLLAEDKTSSSNSSRTDRAAAAAAVSHDTSDDDTVALGSRPSVHSTAPPTMGTWGAEEEEVDDDADDEMGDAASDSDEDGLDMTGVRRTYTVRLGAGHRCLTLTSTISGNGAPRYERLLAGMEETDMEEYFINWLVAAVEGMDDAIEQSRGISADMSKFLDVVNHFFGATVTLLMEE